MSGRLSIQGHRLRRAGRQRRGGRGGGVVTWSGRKNGYGNVVEVGHADGYTTLYAHNQKNLVEVGDLV